MRYSEEYSCGCVSAQSSKKDLAGYCEKHGNGRRLVMRSDGLIVWPGSQVQLVESETNEKKNKELKQS